MPTDAKSYLKRKAKERASRGFTSFTRPERREAIYGRTEGESTLSKVQRVAQTGQERGAKKSRSKKRMGGREFVMAMKGNTRRKR